MSGYVIAGYVVAIGTLSGYGATLLRRERVARLRSARRRAAPGPAAHRTETPGPVGPARPAEGP